MLQFIVVVASTHCWAVRCRCAVGRNIVESKSLAALQAREIPRKLSRRMFVAPQLHVELIVFSTQNCSWICVKRCAVSSVGSSTAMSRIAKKVSMAHWSRWGSCVTRCPMRIRNHAKLWSKLMFIIVSQNRLPNVEERKHVSSCG